MLVTGVKWSDIAYPEATPPGLVAPVAPSAMLLTVVEKALVDGRIALVIEVRNMMQMLKVNWLMEKFWTEAVG